MDELETHDRVFKLACLTPASFARRIADSLSVMAQAVTTDKQGASLTPLCRGVESVFDVEAFKERIFWTRLGSDSHSRGSDGDFEPSVRIGFPALQRRQ